MQARTPVIVGRPFRGVAVPVNVKLIDGVFRAVAEASLRGAIEERIAAHKISCDLTWGYLHCILKPHLYKHLEEYAADFDALGYAGNTLLSKSELEEKLGTKVYYGALRESRAGHLHPLNYCLGLAAAAKKAGAVIYKNAEVTELDTSLRRYD